MMPLYTGGLTSSAKQVANIKAKRSELNTKQQQDLQRFELNSSLLQCSTAKTVTRI